MTPQEHLFLTTMFVRVYEMLTAIRDALTSNGIWIGDDDQAFSQAVYTDRERYRTILASVELDYRQLASLAGISLDGTVPSSAQSSEPEFHLEGLTC